MTPETRNWGGKIGLVRDLNPGPLAPEARIIPLDQRAALGKKPPRASLQPYPTASCTARPTSAGEFPLISQVLGQNAFATQRDTRKGRAFFPSGVGLIFRRLGSAPPPAAIRPRFGKPPSTSQDSPWKAGAAGRWKPGPGGRRQGPSDVSDSARGSQPRVSMPPVSLLAGRSRRSQLRSASEHLALRNVPRPHSQPLLGRRKTLGCRRPTRVGGAGKTSTSWQEMGEDAPYPCKGVLGHRILKGDSIDR